MNSYTQLSKEFQKSEDLEQCLSRLNSLIEGIAVRGEKENEPALPVLFLVGSPRSGTTLLLQWLASSGLFGVPSNLLARFYGNPGFGALVQKVLVDLDKEDQLGLKLQAHQFESRLGRSKGATSPSEFWYFWRRYFIHDGVDKLSTTATENFDREGFLNDLASLEFELGRPLAMKGMIANFDIDLLASLSSRFLFVNIKRSLPETVASILRSRKVYCGSEGGWWSFRPPGYSEWLNWPPVEQVAAQVLTIRKSIKRSLRSLPAKPGRYVEVDLEAFREAPAETANALSRLISMHGFEISGDYLLANVPEFREPSQEYSPADESIEEAISTVCARMGLDDD